MTECKYQHQCEAYQFLEEHSNLPRCKSLLEICELENPSEINEACNIYDTFANPVAEKPLNKKSYLTKK